MLINLKINLSESEQIASGKNEPGQRVGYYFMGFIRRVNRKKFLRSLLRRRLNREV
jgi:hypothetical protein